MTKKSQSAPSQKTTPGQTIDLPPYVWFHHGSHWVRRFKRYVRLTAEPGTAAFHKEYIAALAYLESRKLLPEIAPRVTGPKDKTLGWIASKYFGSAEFQRIDARSQRNRRAIIEDCLRELYHGEPMRDCPLDRITAAKIKALRDVKVTAGKLGAANNRLKYLSSMFGWAVEDGLMPSNPARDVRKARYATDGFHTWTPEEVTAYLAHYQIGTTACLAVALLLFLGVRRSDVVHLGPGQVRDEVLSFVPRKTRYKRMTPSHKPILPILRRIIDASPTGDKTFLVTRQRKPFSVAGFGIRMRRWCDDAGLPQCSAHGLRKAGATMAAENGATTHQLMAIYDWATPSQAEVYTRAADRKRLAQSAMHLLENKTRTSEREQK